MSSCNSVELLHFLRIYPKFIKITIDLCYIFGLEIFEHI